MSCNCDFKYGDGDRFRVMRHLIAGPVTFVLYALYAIGFTVYHNLSGWKANAWKYIYGPPFLVLDILYNIIVGSFIWWELPKETLYTSRLERKKEEGHALAHHLCGYLNIYDEDHC